MVLGTMMEIAFMLLGIFSLINDPLFGIALIIIVIIMWTAGLIWDKWKYGDKFYSWKQLRKLWEVGTSGDKKQ